VGRRIVQSYEPALDPDYIVATATTRHSIIAATASANYRGINNNSLVVEGVDYMDLMTS